MRSLFWVCAAAIVISCVASVNLWRELRAEHESATSLRGQLEQATIPERVITLSALPMPLAVPAPAANQPALPAAKPAPRVATEPAAVRDFADEQRALWSDPEYRGARLAQIRTSISRNDPGLAKALGLSPAEADRLLDLMSVLRTQIEQQDAVNSATSRVLERVEAVQPKP